MLVELHDPRSRSQNSHWRFPFMNNKDTSKTVVEAEKVATLNAQCMLISFPMDTPADIDGAEYLLRVHLLNTETGRQITLQGETWLSFAETPAADRHHVNHDERDNAWPAAALTGFTKVLRHF